MPLLALLGFAFLGGLILNLMPCVLPVLSLKVMTLLDSGTSPTQARAHALWYTAGILCAFAAIGLSVVALQSGGRTLGWGFQLQQPVFVALLAWLMTLIGLSMAGLLTLNAPMGSTALTLLTKKGHAGDFWTGALACVVASPCVAPFMGPALAYAFAAPAYVALAIFLMLGLGLAAPFLLIGFIPRLAKLLPKPGAWMETLKVVLAFPMLLTTVWLLWVLGKQTGIDAIAIVLTCLVVLALGVWQFERSRWTGHWPQKSLGLAIILASLGGTLSIEYSALARASTEQHDTRPSNLDGAIPYSSRGLQMARAEGRQVLVAVTADWCITCMANEQAVLSSSTFHDALERSETVYMKGDWTSRDPEVGALLKEHASPGVPLYVLYRGHDNARTEVLPQVLTRALIAERLTWGH
ncbi:thioredoxin family protein [Stenotrophomonas sp. YAU14A_MKIMI4_1]|uniref:protein-disulfide reductase DsbD family protein n=1 Tax=Stenotrophomonas sp. YAU14A_MKIMI4_1 TaxID=2072408 RepID=UPI00131F0EFF|nr:thioredoxin family protein [Stenotrophomonas sp. YAU14A_MKIMI4_1]